MHYRQLTTDRPNLWLTVGQKLTNRRGFDCRSCRYEVDSWRSADR